MLTDLDKLQSFLGWCLVINMVIYLIWVAAVCFARDWMIERHVQWFAIEADKLRIVWYLALAVYKMLLIFFNFVPWLALVIMNG